MGVAERQSAAPLPVRDRHRKPRPTSAQRRWLRRGLLEPGGKLPLFDANGQRVGERTVRSSIENGWAESWFANPIRPDWLVCKLTPAGRSAILDGGA